MNYILSFLLAGITSLTALSQQGTVKTFDGFYNGINLNVQCRASVTTPWKARECIDSVKVNGKSYEQLLFQGYEIDITNRLDLKMNDSVSVEVYLPNNCELRFINPSDFIPAGLKPVSHFQLTEDSLFQWQMAEVYPDLRIWVQIEHYRWGRWVKLEHNFNVVESNNFTADFSKHFLRGENQFRAVVATIDHQRVASEPLMFKSKAKKIKAKLSDNVIKLSRPSYYEIYAESNLISGKGYASKIDLSDIHGPDGIYILYYGDCELRLKKENEKLIRLK